jgi:predicted permease
MLFRRKMRGLLALIRKQRLDNDLEAEIRAHLELAEQDATARGVSPEAARMEALRKFGSVELVKERHRDRRGFPWMEAVLRDVRYSAASLVRTPGFSAIVIGVLALGIGGTVAMFSVVDAVFLRPLPFPTPERIVSVWEAPRPGAINATTVPQFYAWKRLGTSFEALAAEQPVLGSLDVNGEPMRLSGDAVTSEYFDVFGTRPALGRVFTPDDERPGSAPVLVLTHAAWRTYFGSDPGILNRRLMLDGQVCRVVGVLEPGPFDRSETQFWRALAFSQEQRSSETHWLTVYGRIKPGATLTQVREQMRAIHAVQTETAGREERESAIVIEPLSRLLMGSNLQRSVFIAFGAIFLVLLIACANVANLFFAKGATRRTELAVRASLGAGRGRLVAQLLTESFVLCAAGGLAGGGIAYMLIRAGRPVLSESLPFTADVSLHPHVLLFGAAAIVGVGILTGIFPAIQASLGNLAESLQQSSRGSSGAHIRVRRAIVIGEVALSLVLVCGAFLLTRSLLNLQQLDTGVRIENVLTMSLDLPRAGYATPEKAALFYDALTERLRSVPGVEKVGLGTYLPLEWISNGEGMQVAGAEKLVHVRFKRVDPGYFSTLNIPLLAGRGISARDRNGTPGIVAINQALAARLADVAGMSEPLGKMVRLTSSDYGEGRPRMLDVEIAGIIRSERTASLGRPDPPVVYVPLAQAPNPHIKILVRTRDGTAVLPAIRQAVRQVDPGLPLGDVATMRQVRDRTLSGVSRPAWLIGSFAVIAVLLSAIGLYGVLAYSVTRQRRELGIRMALGARPGELVSHVLRSALAMIAAGLLFGTAGVFVLTRALRHLLFEVSPLDPLALIAACLGMALIGLIAGFFPARRAARVDPVSTLRDAG